MRVAVFPDQVARNGAPVLEAFITSLEAAGLEVSLNDMSADAAVIWSVLWHGRMKENHKVWRHYRAQRKAVIVLEVGAIQRETTWKVAIGGINRDATWGEGQLDLSRPAKLGMELQPWREDGDHILICGQHGRSEQWVGLSEPNLWMNEMGRLIRAFSDRPIIMRPHPRWPTIDVTNITNAHVSVPHKIAGSYDDFDFDKDLNNCHAVFSHSSGTGQQSIIKGIPAWVSSSSMAWNVARDINDVDLIESPLRPARENWLIQVSHTEWTVEEIAAGLPLERLLTTLEKVYFSGLSR